MTAIGLILLGVCLGIVGTRFWDAIDAALTKRSRKRSKRF